MLSAIRLIVVIVFTFLVCEQSTRVMWYGPRFAFSYSTMRTFNGNTRLIQASAIPEIGFEYRPSVVVQQGPVEFEINSLGLRNREVQLPKPADRFRIALVGDSVSAGRGVERDKLFPTLLESTVSSTALAGKELEVVNFAVEGYDLRQYAAVVEHKVPPVEPDLLLITLCENDLYFRAERFYSTPNAFNISAKEEAEATGLQQFWRSHFRDSSFWRSHFLLILSAWWSHVRSDNAAPVERNTQLHIWETALETQFGRIAERAKDLNIPVVVVFLRFGQAEPRELERLFPAAAAKYGMWYLDMLPHFQEESDLQKFNITPWDRHPNELAHQRYAAILTEFLTTTVFPAVQSQ